jgi:hypothetical protein
MGVTCPTPLINQARECRSGYCSGRSARRPRGNRGGLLVGGRESDTLRQRAALAASRPGVNVAYGKASPRIGLESRISRCCTIPDLWNGAYVTAGPGNAALVQAIVSTPNAVCRTRCRSQEGSAPPGGDALRELGGTRRIPDRTGREIASSRGSPSDQHAVVSRPYSSRSAPQLYTPRPESDS